MDEMLELLLLSESALVDYLDEVTQLKRIDAYSRADKNPAFLTNETSSLFSLLYGCESAHDELVMDALYISPFASGIFVVGSSVPIEKWVEFLTGKRWQTDPPQEPNIVTALVLEQTNIGFAVAAEMRAPLSYLLVLERLLRNGLLQGQRPHLVDSVRGTLYFATEIIECVLPQVTHVGEMVQRMTLAGSFGTG